MYLLSIYLRSLTINLQVEEFVEKDCIPADAVFQSQLGEGEKRWQTTPAVLEELKLKAQKLGLWNMFLPKNHFSQGAGFSNLEYGLMAEYLGRSKLASEVSWPLCSILFAVRIRMDVALMRVDLGY